MFAEIYRRYFSTAQSALAGDVRGDLWTGAAAAEPGTRDANEASLLLEQYKIYVEMADRVSARRATTNTFFLTLSSAIFSAIGFVWGRDAHPHGSWLVRSYRQLNGAKYAVIGAMEERLPASPYWAAEWKALGEGKDPARYWPLTHLEQWLPLLFAITYLGGFIAIMTA